MFAPENQFEYSLIKAATDPSHRPQFLGSGSVRSLQANPQLDQNHTALGITTLVKGNRSCHSCRW